METTTYFILGADKNSDALHKHWIDAQSALDATIIFMYCYPEECIIMLDVDVIDVELLATISLDFPPNSGKVL